jgi:hypothetical protein
MILSKSSRTKGRASSFWRWPPKFALCTITLAIAAQTIGCGSKTPEHESASAAEWREFQGTWTATGTRSNLALGDDRRSAISHFTGSLMLAGDSRPAVGFRAEAIVFNDSVSGMEGRAAWTDDIGEQIFSELRGEGTSTNNKIVGTFLGGTGRYAGVTGSYEFAWRFLLETEDGTVQGQSIGLKGRVRLGQRKSASDSGASR